MDLTVNQAGSALRRFESYPLHCFRTFECCCSRAHRSEEAWMCWFSERRKLNTIIEGATPDNYAESTGEGCSARAATCSLLAVVDLSSKRLQRIKKFSIF